MSDSSIRGDATSVGSHASLLEGGDGLTRTRYQPRCDVLRQAAAGKDFEFEDRGEVELKGCEQPVRVWAVRDSDRPLAAQCLDSALSDHCLRDTA